MAERYLIDVEALSAGFKRMQEAMEQFGPRLVAAFQEVGWTMTKVDAGFRGRTVREFTVTTADGECRQVRQVLGGWSR